VNLAAIRAALETWVATTTGLPVQWRERPQGFGERRAVLHLTGFRGAGHDEVQLDIDDTRPPNVEIIPYQTRHRIATLQIVIETPSQADGVDALHYAQALRDSFILPELDALLEAAGCSFGRVLLEPTDLTLTADLRRLSRAGIDFSINAPTLRAGTAHGYIGELTDLSFEAPPGTPVWTGDIEV